MANQKLPHKDQVEKLIANRRKHAAGLQSETLSKRILSGDKIALSEAITLIESTNPKLNEIGQQILKNCLPQSGNSIRIGITGVPGVGKSTFIESAVKYPMEVF